MMFLVTGVGLLPLCTFKVKLMKCLWRSGAPSVHSPAIEKDKVNPFPCRCHLVTLY